jgi:hypothetical protein
MLMFKCLKFKQLGGIYLNLQFGWAPFLREIGELIALSKRVPETINRIRKANGKWLLRKGSVTTEESSTPWGNAGDSRYFGFVHMPSSRWVGSSQYYTNQGVTSYEREVWFSGRFRYFIPELEINDPEWQTDAMMKLSGAVLTPELVWNLIPWSWLIDYFANVGDVFANISEGHLGEIVAKYAYVMGTTTYEQTLHASFRDTAGRTISGSAKRRRVYKARVHASPYGFDVGWGDLSDTQLAILIALGVSKT